MRTPPTDTNHKGLIIIYSRAFRPALVAFSFLNTIALLSCTAGDISNHTIDAKRIGCVFFELDWTVTSLQIVALAPIALVLCA